MVDATHISYPASDRSYFAILKKDIHHKAQEASFNTQKLSELDIVIAELTSNLHKYAKDGELLVGLGKDQVGEYIEIITIDNGPGIADTAKMMQDGVSTSSTMGHGLGSIKRLSDKFDLYSLKDWGTIVLSRIYKNGYKPVPANLKAAVEISPLVVSKPGQYTSGDGCYKKVSAQYVQLLVADGLGHGPEANEAINAGVKSFRESASHSPVEILRQLHKDIRKTRGMVSTMVVVNTVEKKVSIAGIGNISAKFFSYTGNVKTHISYNGIVGHNIPNTMNDQELALADYNLLILCSDGIKSRWEISKYTGINKCDPMLLNAAIYKDYSRRTDDTSVISVKLR